MMNHPEWSEVDRYITGRLHGPDDVLDATLQASAAAGLPDIQVSACFGKSLHLMARAMGARRILEIGTLAGYSTIWLARALPAGGRLISLEADPKHAKIARANVDRADLAHVVEVRLGKAVDTLPQLAAENAGAFDFVFIDADKQNIPGYFEWAVRLGRPGSMIIVDNVVREGAVLDAASPDTAVQGVRRFMDQLSKDSRVSATAIQTVGSKHYDGFAMAVIVEAPNVA